MQFLLFIVFLEIVLPRSRGWASLIFPFDLLMWWRIPWFFSCRILGVQGFIILPISLQDVANLEPVIRLAAGHATSLFGWKWQPAKARKWQLSYFCWLMLPSAAPGSLLCGELGRVQLHWVAAWLAFGVATSGVLVVPRCLGYQVFAADFRHCRDWSVGTSGTLVAEAPEALESTTRKYTPVDFCVYCNYSFDTVLIYFLIIFAGLYLWWYWWRPQLAPSCSSGLNLSRFWAAGWTLGFLGFLMVVRTSWRHDFGISWVAEFSTSVHPQTTRKYQKCPEMNIKVIAPHPSTVHQCQILTHAFYQVNLIRCPPSFGGACDLCSSRVDAQEFASDILPSLRQEREPFLPKPEEELVAASVRCFLS